MSVPRPAMFVAIVIAPALPAWAMMWASFSWYLAFSTWWGSPRFLRSRDRSSESSIEVVPISTGRPPWWSRSTSSATASNFPFFVR